MNHAQIRKNKIRRIFLIAFLCCAFGCLLAGAFISGMPFEAHAEAKNLNDESTATLFLPENYENYLHLENPSSVAIGENRIAIADGQKIYLYDRSDPSKGYRVWDHKAEAGGVTVGKLQFTDDDRLFFASTSGLFELSFTDGFVETKVSDDFTPYTFLIAENTLYVVTMQEGTAIVLYRFEMENNNFKLENAIHTDVSSSSSQQSSPFLAYAAGTLYCSLNGFVYKYDGSNLHGNGNFSLDGKASGVLTPSSVCAIGDKLYFTDKSGLHRTDISSGNSEIVVEGEGLNALYPRGDLLYCLWGGAVRTYNTATNTFTDYEIASASASVGRLSGAKEIVRTGPLVVTADTDNHRVTVYDSTTGQYSTLAPDDEGFSPTLVATDGRIVAAASGRNVYLYVPYAGEYRLADTQECNNNITSVVCLYGACYFVTGGNGYGKIVRTASGESPGESIPTPDVYGLEGGRVVTRDEIGSPHALAYDLYGTIYVMYEGGTVRTFTEETFCAQGDDGTELTVKIPTEAKSLRADFQGNLYYLKEGKMYCNGEETAFAEIDGKDFVYTGNASKQPVSFALGFEDDEVYFLFGDFIVKSNAGALGFPSLGTISAEGIYDEVTRVHKKDEGGVSLLDVKEHSIGIRVALEKLDKETAFFPYSSYSRTNETERAVQLAQTDGYRLVALYENKTYTVELFREEDLVVYGEEDEDPAFAPSWTGESGTRYFAVDTFVYNYPCLSAARTKVQLPRGTRVQLCDVVLPIQSESVAPASVNGENVGSENGFKFAYVEYTDAEGNAAFGYLPLSFLSTIDPTGVQNETFTLGTLKENVSFQDENGERIDVAAGEEVMLYDNGDGTFTAAVERDGVRYTAQVNDKIVSHGESNALRIALIVILTALAVVIIGAYFYLLPRSKYGKKKN